MQIDFLLLNFNSSVVRLKGKSVEFADKAAEQFQFQCGSIKSYHIYSYVAINFHFNSSVVRLKVKGEGVSLLPIKNFNSSVVRLKERT